MESPHTGRCQSYTRRGHYVSVSFPTYLNLREASVLSLTARLLHTAGHLQKDLGLYWKYPPLTEQLLFNGFWLVKLGELQHSKGLTKHFSILGKHLEDFWAGPTIAGEFTHRLLFCSYFAWCMDSAVWSICFIAVVILNTVCDKKDHGSVTTGPTALSKNQYRIKTADKKNQ